jgi:hypothetical protein
VDLRYHNFYRHYELSFRPREGRDQFRADVNRIFQRGQVMYELRENGEVHRRGTPEVQAVIARLDPATGDTRLDEMIMEARALYTSHRAGNRAVALERLLDAFERLKTIDIPGGDKRASVQVLLNNLDAGWRATIENEMKALTDIGNTYEIRHFETRATALPAGTARDYLFTRMRALLTELLSASSRLQTSQPTTPRS